MAVKLSQCSKARFGSTGQIAGAFLIKCLNRCHSTSQSTHGQSIFVVILNVAFAYCDGTVYREENLCCSALYLAVGIFEHWRGFYNVVCMCSVMLNWGGGAFSPSSVPSWSCYCEASWVHCLRQHLLAHCSPWAVRSSMSLPHWHKHSTCVQEVLVWWNVAHNRCKWMHPYCQLQCMYPHVDCLHASCILMTPQGIWDCCHPGCKIWRGDIAETF